MPPAFSPRGWYFPYFFVSPTRTTSHNHPGPTEPLYCMHDESGDVWLWSSAFVEIMEDLIREPLPNRAARPDWPAQRDRLGRWLQQVEAARRLYEQGCPEPLSRLYDYWRATGGDDTREQARFASETYRQLCFASGA